MRGKVLNMNIVAINKFSSKLKVWSVEMPNAQYSNRYTQMKNRRQLWNEL